MSEAIRCIYLALKMQRIATNHLRSDGKTQIVTCRSTFTSTSIPKECVLILSAGSIVHLSFPDRIPADDPVSPACPHQSIGGIAWCIRSHRCRFTTIPVGSSRNLNVSRNEAPPYRAKHGCWPLMSGILQQTRADSSD